jgi:hypothetical protein
MANKSTAFAKNLNMLNIIGLRESIETLMTKEGKYAPVAAVCKAYLKKLDEGWHEGQVCTSFVNELTRVAIHESSKDVVFDLGNKLNEHKRDIDIVNNLFAMQQGRHSYVVPMVESALVDYMTNKNAETRTTARKSLSLFEGIVEINGILEALSFDEYEEKTNKKLVNSSLNESFIPNEPETFTKEQVDAMLENAKATAIKEQEAPVAKSINGVDSHIYLDNTIKSILKKNTTNNEGLKAFCEQYIQALNAGKAEEVLYESFISGVSHWNHLSAVDTELSALNDRISKYQQEVNLKKILKIMESTGSYYIVPLIEGCVVDYIANKTMANKSVLKQRLQAFEYDPFVRDILNIVMHDQSLEANVYLGESLESVNNYVHTEKVFSPVKYIKENECVFNVKGTYYNRKGNTITKLSKSSIENLDESFKTLCNLINHPAVSIDDLSNTIAIYEGKDSAKISESSIILNGNEVTVDEIDNIAHMSNLMNENKQGFYAAVKMINEKFDEIAYIDFVKRVAMNESNGKTVDVFRIKNNLFVATNDVKLGSSTFYRNVNPIQCRSYINEHMSLNVSSLFEDILPNQKAILEGVEEAKKEYETYIEELKNKKKEFEALRGECEGADADIDKAISIIDDDIADMEKDYEKYKKDAEQYMTGDDADAETETPDDIAANYGANTTEEPTESPEDMEVPIGEEPAVEEPAMDADVAAMADEFAAEDEAIASATPYDADFDVVAPELEDKGGVKVLRVSYAENVKTGKKLNKGTAFVVIPSVDANGDVKDETKSITFYLDADRKPIINNEYMPLIIYKSIVDAISADADTASIDVNGTAEVDTPADSVEVTTSVTAVAPAEDVVADPAAEIADAIVEPTEETEPMAGLEADPDAPADTVTDLPTDGEAALGDDQALDIDSMIDNIGNTDFEDGAEGETEIDGELDGQLDDFLGTEGAEGADEGEEIPAATQETPAETASRTESETYPIELGLNTEDIKPISKGRFTEACKEMGIECSTVEGQNDCVTLKFKNKAEVYAMQDYFKDWKNYSQAQFCNFFPELKKCFANNPSVPVAQKVSEGVSILGVRAINESVLYSDSKNGTVNLVLPYTEDYAKMFGYSNGKNRPSHINIVTESYAETQELYKTLSAYASTKGNKIDEDAKSFLNRYSKEFESLTESNIYSLTVPYNNFLEQKLEHKGIACSRVDEGLAISLHKDEYAKAKKVFESVYGEKTPVSVKDFFHLADSSLDEGLKITVKDDKTGKTVEFDLDDLAGKAKDSEDADSPADEQNNFDDAFKDVTFDSKDSELFNVGDDDSDDEKDEEKSSEDDDNTDDEQLETKKDSEEKDSETEEEKPAKKKFMFRKKKNESVTSPSFKNPLNESTGCSATPNVLDWVKLSDGNVAQVIATLPMSGNYIVNLNGRTVEVSPNNLVLAGCKKDLVEAPHKFDKATLKLLSESMVRCGMFVNNNQITPNGCYVKYGDFVNAKDDEQIRIVVEGESVLASKKYIKVLEDINTFAVPSGFVSAEEISEIGVKLRDILVNVQEFEAATAATDPVTAMVYNNATGEYDSYVLPKESIRLSAV